MQSSLKKDDLNNFYNKDISYFKQQKEKTKELYEWQNKAIEYFFNNNCKAIFEVPTGVGKTLSAIEIIKKIWEKDPEAHILIVVPKNVILETGWYKELYDNEIPLQDIGVYYGLTKEYAKITLTNMQSLDKVSLKRFSCCIADECHNYTTPRLLKLLKHPFKYMLGLTATLGKLENRKLELLKTFDYKLFKYSMKDALVDNVLNPFELIMINIEMDKEDREEYERITQEINYAIKKAGGIRNMFSGETKNSVLAKMNERKQMVNNYYKKFEIVGKICAKHKGNKIIIFNEYNAQTTKLYWNLLDENIKACIVHSGISKENREQNLIDFRKEKYNVILASKVLDEGWNLPKLDVAVISAGNSTNRQTIQRMGRVLRKKEELSKIYLINVKDTIEQKYAIKKRKILEELSDNFQEIFIKKAEDLWKKD